MTIEFDNVGPWEVPRERREPAIKLSAVLAVDVVTLAAREVKQQALRSFYTELLGFEWVAEDREKMVIKFERQRVILKRGEVVFEEQPVQDEEAEGTPLRLGKLIMVTRHFDAALHALRERMISCDVLHTDGGLTRSVLFPDPAGNLLQLNETRPV